MIFVPADFIFKINLFEIDFFEKIKVANSLDPDQSRRFIGPDLGPKSSAFKGYRQMTLVG